MSIDATVIAAVLSAVGAGLGAVFANIGGRRLSRVQVGGIEVELEKPRVTARADEQRQETLEDRLGHLSELMGQSRILVEQVSAELDARAATARQLQEEVKEAEALAVIHREQADAIRRLIDAELEANRKAMADELTAKLTENSTAVRKDVRKDAIRIGIGSFVAGGGLTFLITLLVHPLH